MSSMGSIKRWLEEKIIELRIKRKRNELITFPYPFKQKEKQALIISQERENGNRIENFFKRRGIKSTIISESFIIFSKRYRNLKRELKGKEFTISIVVSQPAHLCMLALPFFIGIPIRIGVNIEQCDPLVNIYLNTKELETGLAQILNLIK